MHGHEDGMTPGPNDPAGLNREAVVEAALQLIAAGGVEALSMRAIADRLGVKAASLYWHVRDKEQLLELVTETVLDTVEVPVTGTWRQQAEAAAAQLAQTLRRRRGVAQLMVGALPSVRRSRLTRDLARALALAGVEQAEAAAFQIVLAVLAGAEVPPPQAALEPPGAPKTLEIDTGSYGVTVRAAGSDDVDVARSLGGGGAAWLDVRPDGHVIVRNRKGGYRGAVELSPLHTWAIKVHGGTWSTTLDLTGLRVSGVELDSGAGNVRCTLPAPVGVVPVTVNSGLVNVELHRPGNSAAVAVVHTGSVKVRLDDQAIKSYMSDTHWSSPGAGQAQDRFDVVVHSGCVKVTLDASAPAATPPAPSPVPSAVPEPPPLEPAGGPAGVDPGVALILDGLERQVSRATS
jgi:AcrR family transcriptional regulator